MADSRVLAQPHSLAPLAPGLVRGRGVSLAAAFARDRAAVLAAVALVLFGLLGALAGLLERYPYDAQDLGATFRGPGPAHFLGTDNLGRDLFSRLLHAVRVSYAIGLSAVAVELLAGSLLGAAAGYHGGWVDSAVMRAADLLFAFPPLLLAILLTGILGPTVPNIVLAIGISSWPGMARTVRAEVLSLRQREFIEAGRAIGATDARLILRHLLPNTYHLIAVRATLGVGVAIIAEATLSFLGLGIQAPTPSLGSMISEGYRYLRSQPYLLLEPALILSLLMVAFNFAGEGLADSLDPARRKPLGR